MTFTLANEAPGRNYTLPIGTLIETAAPVIRFRTTDTAILSSAQRTATLPATAVLSGASGNVAASAIIQIDPIYASHYLSLGSATIAATNSAPLTGGDLLADDETYRAQLLLLRHPLHRSAVSATVLNVDGVRDCRVSDPLGGVDVSLSILTRSSSTGAALVRHDFSARPTFSTSSSPPSPVTPGTRSAPLPACVIRWRRRSTRCVRSGSFPTSD